MTPDPDKTEDTPTPLTTTQKVFLIVLAVVVLALLGPPILWAIGHGLVPLWNWGVSWIG